MSRKHIFSFDDPRQPQTSLGDSAMRICAISGIIQKYDLDALIIPHKGPVLLPLWRRAFGGRVLQDEADIPESHWDATISRPTARDSYYGNHAWTVFEYVWWEMGFFKTHNMWIAPPVLYRCDVTSKAAMVYPTEYTEGNRVYTAAWWYTTLTLLLEKGYAINILGNAEPFCRDLPHRQFPATIEGLEQCIAASSLAIGGSTGPTWACLLSDIPQIVLDSRRSIHGTWFFDRCQCVLAKRLRNASTLESLLI